MTVTVFIDGNGKKSFHMGPSEHATKFRNHYRNHYIKNKPCIQSRKYILRKQFLKLFQRSVLTVSSPNLKHDLNLGRNCRPNLFIPTSTLQLVQNFYGIYNKWAKKWKWSQRSVLTVVVSICIVIKTLFYIVSS